MLESEEQVRQGVAGQEQSRDQGQVGKYKGDELGELQYLGVIGVGVNFGFVDVGDDSASGQHHGSHGGGNDHGGKCEDNASKDRAAQSFH
ncbi:hypothetical protein KGMB01110_29200 [Mediterraneibacter butyricigenes]|uniref:Uncharacterized protein n=1 Tax=Mediterraneibacter butyricigenes TaxID=2316025 RepID=A0A391P313_9FIRM|nr:hypothetical protein KGMB01110_29200 [Mediterraneibacter butyricigenes]